MTPIPARGTKYTCTNVSCQTKFYDLNKEAPACPKCGQAVAIEKVRTRRPAEGRAPKAKRWN